MDDAVYGHTMIGNVNRHGERQNHNQRCRHRRPMTFDKAACHESSRSRHSCDTTGRGVKCRIQWFHWAPIDFSLRQQ
jgi:hypothetical protein